MKDHNPDDIYKPLLRGHFHQEMFFIALGACIPLICRCDNARQFIATTVYSLGGLILFGVSALYHRINWIPKKRLIWKKLDHANIYLMIAGTFTPIALLGLAPERGTNLLILIWSVAIAGIFQSLFFVNIPKMASAVLYLIAGYLILPYISELKSSIGLANVWLIIAGGISYSIGAICYGLRFPNFRSRVIGYHEVFHIFVNIGAILHFIVVSSFIH